MEVKFGNYFISTEKSLLNHETIYQFLASSYWASNRPTEIIDKSIETSFCFGVYHGNRQIGFARIITDWATTYWIGDVMIDEEYRGEGIGKKLIETITSCEELKNLNGILGTADAHGLYEQYGFVKNPDRFMIRRQT